mmetsp:Transcript_5970/g.17868  ORF Transcript_5970/g.17868 Transcript_5970/m.17868 type:complete len:243 (-) Transcript_5970:115-843(-)
MPFSYQLHAMIKITSIRIDRICRFHLATTRMALPDAIPWLSTLGVMDVEYLVNIRDHTILTNIIRAVISALPMQRLLLLLKVGSVSIPYVHPHVIVPALVDLHRSVGTDDVVKVRHQPLHRHRADVSAVTGAAPPVLSLVTSGEVSLQYHVLHLLNDAGIVPCDQESRLEHRLAAGNHLRPISGDERVDLGRQRIVRTFHLYSGSCQPALHGVCVVQYGVVQVIHGLVECKVDIDVHGDRFR